jgi:hypothetical protein
MWKKANFVPRKTVLGPSMFASECLCTTKPTCFNLITSVMVLGGEAMGWGLGP